MKSNYHVLFPHDDISVSFIKFLNEALIKAKFEKSFERMDPGGVDMYRYQNKKGQSLVITRSPIDRDNNEIIISSDEIDITKNVDRAANAFGRYIAGLVKSGRKKR